MNRVDSHSYADSSPDEDDTGRSSDEECSDFDLSGKKRLGKINDCQIFTMSKLVEEKGEVSRGERWRIGWLCLSMESFLFGQIRSLHCKLSY